MQIQSSWQKLLPAQRSRVSVRFLMGLATGLVGLANMLSLIFPRPDWNWLIGAWPISAHHDGQKLTVVVGFLLIMLSYGLARGKHQAWCVTVLLLLMSVLLHAFVGSTLFTTALALVLLTLLVFLSRFFQARSDPPSVWRGYAALLIGMGIVLLYSIGGFIALFDQFEPLFDHFSDHFSIDEVIIHLLTNAHMLYLMKGSQAAIFGCVLPKLCLCAVLYGVGSILRPVAAVLHPNEQERSRGAQLAHLYGCNSISYFALDAENSFFFPHSGKSVISYVLEGNVAVVAGDPIGPEEELEMVIRQFIDFCYEQDWTIVFWQVLDSTIELYRAAGLHTLKIGEDAVVDTQTFTLAGKAMANVRTSAKRAEKDGLQVIFSNGPVQDAEQLAQMEQISRAWLAKKGNAEMGFSMGRFDPHTGKELIYALAIDTINKVHGFVTFVPIYGRQGWGLDLMRRSEQAAPGTMELLLARSIEHLKGQGAQMVSLGLAPLSNANNNEENFFESGIDFLSKRFGDPQKGQSLFNFKKKFQPRWESRYLVFSDTMKLPTIGWALYHAHQRDASLLKTLRQSIREWQERYHTTHKSLAVAARIVGQPVTGEGSLT